MAGKDPKVETHSTGTDKRKNMIQSKYKNNNRHIEDKHNHHKETPMTGDDLSHQKNTPDEDNQHHQTEPTTDSQAQTAQAGRHQDLHIDKMDTSQSTTGTYPTGEIRYANTAMKRIMGKQHARKPPVGSVTSWASTQHQTCATGREDH